MSSQKSINIMSAQVADKVEDGNIIGLGSGSAVTEFVRKLGERVTNNNITCTVIPSSLQIQLIAEQSGLISIPYTMIPDIDITVDGADQINEKFNMIKGGGGALYCERILLRAAKKSIILADETKYVKQLNKAIPVETSKFARVYVTRELQKLGGKVAMRMLDKGYPFNTENGNIILDTMFDIIEKPNVLQRKINKIAGIIDAGIFIDEGNVFYKANIDGTVHNFEVR